MFVDLYELLVSSVKGLAAAAFVGDGCAVWGQGDVGRLGGGAGGGLVLGGEGQVVGWWGGGGGGGGGRGRR